MRRLFFSLFLASFLLTAIPSNAQFLNTEARDKLRQNTDTFRGAAGFEQQDADAPEVFIGKIINAFLSLLGILFLGLLIYGGYTWMNAQGNEEEVAKAKKIITQAVIGIAIVLSAYVISRFVVGTLQEKTLGPTQSQVEESKK